MAFVFLCLDDLFYLMCWSFIAKCISRLCSSLNGEKVFYTRNLWQQQENQAAVCTQKNAVLLMIVNFANFEQSILFGPFQMYELSSYYEI